MGHQRMGIGGPVGKLAPGGAGVGITSAPPSATRASGAAPGGAAGSVVPVGSPLGGAAAVESPVPSTGAAAVVVSPADASAGSPSASANRSVGMRPKWASAMYGTGESLGGG